MTLEFSSPARKWLTDAAQFAQFLGHDAIYPEHLFVTLPQQEQAISLIGALNVNKAAELFGEIEDFRQSLTKDVSKNGVFKSSPSESLATMFAKIRGRIDTNNEFVTTVDIFRGLFDVVNKDNTKPIAAIFIKNGLTADMIDIKINEIDSKIENLNLNSDGENYVSGSDNKQTLLEIYGTDLTKLASEGGLDKIVGRDDEIRKIIKLLSRRSKNTPVLVGEPGVGKNSVVYGLAHRIVAGDVPNGLVGKRLISIELSNVRSGTKLNSEFQDRFRALLTEVKESGDVVLFIDGIEAVNSGSGAADILKSFIAKHNVRLIGATTTDDYRDHLEKDTGLVRLLQKIVIDEPSVSETISILRGTVQKFEDYHKVQIDDEAIVAAVELSDRYVGDRRLPDKAIDLIDEAAAKMRMELDSHPAVLDSLMRKLTQVQMEIAVLNGTDDPNAAINLDDLRQKESKLKSELDLMRTKWENEKSVRGEIAEIEAEIAANENSESNIKPSVKSVKNVASLRSRLKKLYSKLNSDDLMIADGVGRDEIAKVVESWTGIPVGNLLESEAKKLVRMEDEIAKKLIGQKSAVKAVSNAVRRSRAGVADPNRPTGSFLFLGTSGSGKTLLAKAIAKFLFNDESAMTRIDMSEFSEKHSVARLIGAPPGYVGYEGGGQLTEKVAANPYSVVLLDEVEKAHPEIFDILLQVLDDGRLTDGKGRTVDFSNTIIILTSNLGSSALIDDSLTEVEKENFVMTKVREAFRPEFLNRLDETVIFKPFTRDELGKIVDLEVAIFVKRLESRRITFDVRDDAKQWLANEGYDPKYGARPLRRLIQSEIGDNVSTMILNGEVDDDDTVIVSCDESKENLVLKVEKGTWVAKS